ncbi:hypothetical protein [Paracoccus sp. MKU1]|uniref:hypothetical protein n=1 Tax=Paracoccus sp. MKU1 TaxID=1745182 RepID=UPI00350ED6CB
MVTDPAARGCFFHHDLREVTAKGVATVMGSFLVACGLAAETGPSGSETPEPGPPMPPRMSSVRKSCWRHSANDGAQGADAGQFAYRRPAHRPAASVPKAGPVSSPMSLPCRATPGVEGRRALPPRRRGAQKDALL